MDCLALQHRIGLTSGRTQSVRTAYSAGGWTSVTGQVIGDVGGRSANDIPEMASEEAGGIVTRELRHTRVAAHVGVERLLRQSEGVEQLQRRLRSLSSSSHCSRTCTGTVTRRASSKVARGT